MRRIIIVEQPVTDRNALRLARLLGEAPRTVEQLDAVVNRNWCLRVFSSKNLEHLVLTIMEHKRARWAAFQLLAAKSPTKNVRLTGIKQ